MGGLLTSPLLCTSLSRDKVPVVKVMEEAHPAESPAAGTQPVLPASSKHLVSGLELLCPSITSAGSPEGTEGQIQGEIST